MKYVPKTHFAFGGASTPKKAICGNTRVTSNNLWVDVTCKGCMKRMRRNREFIMGNQRLAEALKKRTLRTAADIEPFKPMIEERFKSWYVVPGVNIYWSNLFPIVETLIEGPQFESYHCEAANIVKEMLMAELRSRVASEHPALV